MALRLLVIFKEKASTSYTFYFEMAILTALFCQVSLLVRVHKECFGWKEVRVFSYAYNDNDES